MIIFDTETTGLYKPEIVGYEGQPEIVEFAAIKLDDNTLDEISRLHFVCKTVNPIPEKASAIHGFYDKDVEDKEYFSFYYKDVCEIFLGEKIMVAHNVSFDKNLLRCELGRLKAVTSFPWPMHSVCTVNIMRQLVGQFLNMSKFYKLATGENEIQDAHQAINDVEALIVCVKWLKEISDVKDFNALFKIQ